MKKYLMTGIAAVAMGAAMTSCSHDFEPMSQEEINQIEAQKIVQTYEQAFIKTFGQPAASQDWGFGATSALRTRAVVETPSVSEVGYTFNATMARAWSSAYALAVEQNWGNQVSGHSLFTSTEAWANSGWNDKFYQISASSVPSGISEQYAANVMEAILQEIPEGGNNISKAAQVGYSVETTGGPITVTPVYHVSNSDDMVSYYFYPANNVPTAAEIKSLPKYTIGRLGNEGAMRQSFSLVYVNGDEVSYDFPAGYVICFLVTNNSLENGNQKGYHDNVNYSDTKYIANTPEFYGDGSLNAAIHSTSDWSGNVVTDVNNAPHAATFSANGYSFVGFEDWTDMDCNDLVLAIDGVTGGQEITVVEEEEEEEEEENKPSAANLRIMAEDLSASDDTDFDFNDVVFDVYYGAAGTAKIEILAAGGTLPLRIKTGAGDTDDDFEEVHGMFGENTNIMINTKASYANSKSGLPSVSKTLDYPVNSAADANGITIQVKKTMNGVEQWIEMKAAVGKPAAKFACLPSVVKRWADERESLLTNSTFSKWVQGAISTWQWNDNIK